MKDELTHAQAVEAQREANRAIASEADLEHLRHGKGGCTRAMSEGSKPDAIEFTRSSDPADHGRQGTMMRKHDIQRLAEAIKGQVAKFSDRRLDDGDEILLERELEYRRGIAETANAVCVALQLDAAAFAAACGLYVSHGQDTFNDCRPGELTWEKVTAG